MTAPTPLELRVGVLAVSVLHDLDLLPGDDGVVLTGVQDVDVSWWECRRALAGALARTELGRERLARWLLIRRWLADRPLDELAERARPVGTPVEHVDHPGLDWIRARVLGDSLDLGLGFVGLDPARPDDVVIVPQGALVAAGLSTVADAWWAGALDYLEDMGTMAAARYARTPEAPLKPMGDCDVVTLLASRMLRGALCAAAGGMRPVAVPMRSRGWLDLSRIDPAFSTAAAAATAPAERGFDRPLLVTAEEVVMVGSGGKPAEIVLRDPAPDTPWVRDVLYR
ncbi:MAG: hypothetical protein M3Z02_05225 [Actinomycetota bacterium]|nr:hypothetical protein [Actinomycetota bacterium]